MDPVGLALENFDPIGLYRTHENGVAIDARGGVPGAPGTVDGPVELVRALAAVDGTHRCFANHWLQLAHGRTLGPEDECLRAQVHLTFKRSGYDVKQLLLALTQTDAFLYYGGGE
jgi:hypothetical protein